ncbi:MAG TPA: pyrimidine dimer DNA glycosylase/endonuclease V [Nitrospiria bacterium]|nr:pyrimidine dimer DNA glycosylase/endonuclease V [Nitrospiria bacterium]
MRVWDIPVRRLCRAHLLGEHRELHAVWAILTEGKKGYRNHPETKRWVGALKGLYDRHEHLAAEMSARGYRHQSGLDRRFADGRSKPILLLIPLGKQRDLLRKKGCACRV